MRVSLLPHCCRSIISLCRGHRAIQGSTYLLTKENLRFRTSILKKYLAEKELDMTATLDPKTAYSVADFVVIAASTTYDSSPQHFDTSAVENVIELVMKYNTNVIMIIKSIIPVGYTESVRKKYSSSSEFLHESKALYDNVSPKLLVA